MCEHLFLRVTYSAACIGVCLILEYNLSLNFIDLMMHCVIQRDFLWLCLLYLIILTCKKLSIAVVIISSSRL